MRLFLAVIVSIVVIESAILLPTYVGYRRNLENRLEHVGRTVVVIALKPRGHASEIDLLIYARLAARFSELSGGALYRPDGGLIGHFGERPTLKPGDAGGRPVLMRMTEQGRRLRPGCRELSILPRKRCSPSPTT